MARRRALASPLTSPVSLRAETRSLTRRRGCFIAIRQDEILRETTGDERTCQICQGQEHQILPVQFHRPVRHAARQAGAGGGGRQDAESGRGLCRLRHLARPDAGASRSSRHARSQFDHSPAMAAGSRLGGGRSVDGRQAARPGAAPGARRTWSPRRRSAI